MLTETTNEYTDKYYSFNYPAHWYYEGMGLASKNSGLATFLPNSTTGIYNIANANTLFYPGDELFLNDFSSGKKKLWVKSVTNSSVKLMDENGELYPSSGTAIINSVAIKIVRSGRRNIQSTSMGSVVMMKNPLDLIGTHIPIDFLNTTLWNQYKVVNAGAVEFSEDWELQCECGVDNTNPNFNAYKYNTKGIWRAKRSYLHLTGRHQNQTSPNPRNDGFYNTFSPFYFVNSAGNWGKNTDDWTFTSEVTNYSPYGFELENEDALHRYSSAQYGYNFMFPMAVGSNSRYSQMGYDGFEDYNFEGCEENEHFGFRANEADVSNEKSHTGKYSLKVKANGKIIKVYHIDCE